MSEHLEDRPAHPEESPGHRCWGPRGEDPRRDPQGDEPHVADAGVRDEPLQVVLRQAHDGPVQDADRPEDRRDPVHVLGPLREHLHVHADEGVPPELQEDAREDHGPTRGRLDVRVREPRVDGPRRELRPEAREEGDEQHVLDRPRRDERPAAGLLDQADHAEGPAVEVEREDPDQDGNARDECVEEELQGGVSPAGTAPDGDDEVHRDEPDLPEQEEEEEVQGDEHPEDRRLHEEEHRVELPHPVVLVPVDDQREGRQQAREEYERHGQLVHADRIGDGRVRARVRAEHRHPRGRLVRAVHEGAPDRGVAPELDPGRGEEAQEENDGEHERDHGDGKGGDSRGLRVPPREEHEDRPECGRQKKDREDREVENHSNPPDEAAECARVIHDHPEERQREEAREDD